jgi:hypothetical protein
MSHMWDRGVLDSSSWHGLEEVGVFTDAESMIDHGENSGAWPCDLQVAPLYAHVKNTDVQVPVLNTSALTAFYRGHPARVVGVNGGRYSPHSVGSRNELIRAAVLAGAKPTGAFSLKDGSVTLATFQVNGSEDGIVTNLLMVDSYDGTQQLRVGTTSIRVVCANTLASSLRQDGAGMAVLRHSGNLDGKVRALQDSIGEALKTGQKIRELYNRAKQTRISKVQADIILNKLFPLAEKDAPQVAVTRAENEQREALMAASNVVNNDGSTVATLWNAATYLVDREVDGSARSTRSGDSLSSLLLGQRAKRIDEVQSIIEMVLADGSIQEMTIAEAAQTESQKQGFEDLLSRPVSVI